MFFNRLAFSKCHSALTPLIVTPLIEDVSDINSGSRNAESDFDGEKRSNEPKNQ
ncbi:MAG: hypothetical protein ACJATV_000222 [Granulosicoccus sp.]|jgi:hypothetical protein